MKAALSHDSLWRRSFRSVAHCYSGCGAGEVYPLNVLLVHTGVKEGMADPTLATA